MVAVSTMRYGTFAILFLFLISSTSARPTDGAGKTPTDSTERDPGRMESVTSSTGSIPRETPPPDRTRIPTDTPPYRDHTNTQSAAIHDPPAPLIPSFEMSPLRLAGTPAAAGRHGSGSTNPGRTHLNHPVRAPISRVQASSYSGDNIDDYVSPRYMSETQSDPANDPMDIDTQENLPSAARTPGAFDMSEALHGADLPLDPAYANPVAASSSAATDEMPDSMRPETRAGQVNGGRTATGRGGASSQGPTTRGRQRKV